MLSVQKHGFYIPTPSQFCVKKCAICSINPLNNELNPICHLLALLGADHILHVSRIRVKI